MITFETEDMPNGHSITNDEFAAIHAVVSLDWDSDYRVSTPVLGEDGQTTLVEKVDEDDRSTLAVFKLGVDGDWEQVWERSDRRGSMNYKKIVTLVSTSGKSSSLELGLVDSTHLDSDIADERERFARVALAGPRAMVAQPAIQTVEVAGMSIVAIYESGMVRVINYVPEVTR